MIESSFTLYKLIILYMLQNVNFPLSNTQISDFILEKEYTNYFHLQEALSELQDTKLIEIEKVRNTSYYHMTEEGSKTLSFFENEISPEIREEIDRYMKEHSYELRKKASVVADYYKPAGDAYEVRCQARERKTTIFEIVVTVPSEEAAKKICSNWENRSQKIYASIMNELSR